MKVTNPFLVLVAIVIVSLSTIGFVGLNYTTTVTTIEDTLNLDDGEEIYMTRCLSCHGATGEGTTGVFPPITNSPYVSGDKGALIRMILHGLRGEIVVQDVVYNNFMPPWGIYLSDQEVADVITYIRSNFGNEADAATAEEVAKIRAFVGERTDAWTWEELSQPENQGIPGGE